MFQPEEVEGAAAVAVQQLGYKEIKPEQLQVVAGILRGRDVFAVLPTGFGKVPVLLVYLLSTTNSIHSENTQ